MALGLTLGTILAVSGGSNTTKIHQSAAAAAVAPGNTSSAVNPNCDIIVPAHPLSARGLVSFCNCIKFFRAAFQLEREGRLFVPSAGTSAKIVPTAGATGTGNACPTVRNFDMVDQDQSDNVTTIYPVSYTHLRAHETRHDLV